MTDLLLTALAGPVLGAVQMANCTVSAEGFTCRSDCRDYIVCPQWCDDNCAGRIKGAMSLEEEMRCSTRRLRCGTVGYFSENALEKTSMISF
jgi:hypothetical protein